MFLRLWKWWLQQDSTNLTGLDINTNSIKLLKINSTETPYLLENFSILPLPAGSIINGEVKNPSAVSIFLKDIFIDAGTTEKKVAIAIPRLLVVVKNIFIDNRLNSKEIESRVWIEANKHFPELIGDIYLDFSVIGPSAQDPSQLELSLVACRKTQITPYLEALHSASLNVKVIDVGSYALSRAVAATQNASKLDTIALFNLDDALSSFIVVDKNKLIYAYDQTFDGAHLKNQTQNYFKEAKDHPESKALLDDEKYVNVLRESLSAYLRHAMHVFYSTKPNINLQQVLISGDCANIPGLTQFIQTEIGIETIIANPFTNMKLAPGIDEEKLKANAPALMLCCGIALSQLKYD